MLACVCRACVRACGTPFAMCVCVCVYVCLYFLCCRSSTNQPPLPPCLLASPVHVEAHVSFVFNQSLPCFPSLSTHTTTTCDHCKNNACQGGFRALNRIGLGNHGSPMTQMSFETTSKFLVGSTLHGIHDTMASPSSRIAMGRLIDCGTGFFDVMQPLNINRIYIYVLNLLMPRPVVHLHCLRRRRRPLWWWSRRRPLRRTPLLPGRRRRPSLPP